MTAQNHTSPFVVAGLADRMTVTAPRAGTPTICRRALADRDCPFTHDWLPIPPGASKQLLEEVAGRPLKDGDIPFTRSPHDVRASTEA